MSKKLKRFKSLLFQLRTEWFLFESDGNNPKNINQINTLCKQILDLQYSQQEFEDEENENK